MRSKRVYFLRPIGEAGPVKIGCSVFPEGRLEDESALHSMFRADHMHGEWFKASAKLTAVIDHCRRTGCLPELPKATNAPQIRHKAHTRLRPKPVDKGAWAARIRAEYEAGATLTELAAEHEINVVTVQRMVRLAGGKCRPRGGPDGLRDLERASAMARRFLAGETLQRIANDYGLTRERVRQVLAKMQITGQTRRAARRREVERFRAGRGLQCPRESRPIFEAS